MKALKRFYGKPQGSPATIRHYEPGDEVKEEDEKFIKTLKARGFVEEEKKKAKTTTKRKRVKAEDKNGKPKTNNK